MGSNPPSVLTGMAGLAVCAAASLNSDAHGQTAFSWSTPTNGAWSDPSRWSPAGSPGALSPLDTATLGGMPGYLVAMDVSRTIAALSLSSADAMLQIDPSRELTVTGSLTGDGVVQVSTGLSTANATLTLGDGGEANTTIGLVGFGTDDARLNGPTAMGEFATLGPDALLFGNGTVGGQWSIQGTVHADAGGVLVLNLTDALLTGGGELRETGGGQIQWNNHLVTGITLSGEPSINPGETLRVGPDVTFDAPIVISFSNSFANASLVVEPGVTLNGDVDLRGFGIDDARLTGPAAPGDDAVISSTSTVFGNGTISGYFQFAGMVIAENALTIDFNHPELMLTGGGVLDERDGDFRWNNHIVSDITLRGMLKIDPGESLRVGDGVTFDDPITVSNSNSFANANLDLLDGVVFSTGIVLNGFGPEDAQLRGPDDLLDETATLGPSSTVTGQGTIRGPLVLQGLVRPDAGRTFDLALTDSVLTGGGVIEEIGEINWNNHVATDITLRGDLNIDPGETLRVGMGVTFDNTIVVSNNNSFANANLDLLDGVAFSTGIVLNGFGPEDAQLRGPTEAGEFVTLGPTSTVSGQGTLRGALVFNGLVTVDAGRTVDFSMPASLIAGGGVLEQLGEFQWNSHTVEGVTLRGALDVDPGETLFIGPGAVLEDPIVVGSGNSFANGLLRIRNGVALSGEIVLNGFGVEDARVGGETTEGTSATVGADAIISGRGTVDGRTSAINGTIAPGNGPLGVDTIDIRTMIPVALGAEAVYEVGFAGVGAGQFDRLVNASDLSLGGTLRVDALGGFEPLSTNEIEIITNASGGTYTGRFDSVEYTGNLEAGDVARAFYETDRVVFAVTCSADVTLPAGVLNIFDVIGFINTWDAQGPGADFNEDGNINILDVIAFIALWNVGCPE